MEKLIELQILSEKLFLRKKSEKEVGIFIRDILNSDSARKTLFSLHNQYYNHSNRSHTVTHFLTEMENMSALYSS